MRDEWTRLGGRLAFPLLNSAVAHERSASAQRSALADEPPVAPDEVFPPPLLTEQWHTAFVR